MHIAMKLLVYNLYYDAIVNWIAFRGKHSCFLPDGPAKFWRVLHYSPRLFGKKMFSMQDKLVNNKQTHFLKQNCVLD